MLRILLMVTATVSIGIILYLTAFEKLRSLRKPLRILKRQSSTSKSLRKQGMRDYNTYSMGLKERLICTLQAAVILFFLGYVFYQNLVLSLLLTPLSLFYPKMREREIIKRNKNQLNVEFKDALYAISSSLSAGKAIEASLRDAVKDLKLQYSAEATPMIEELNLILAKIEMNQTVEAAFSDLAAGSHLEDIQNFVDVFATCNRTGGNLVEVMKNTSKIIAEKMDFKQELELLLAQRKFEQRVLMIIPVALMIALRATAADYMEPVFTTLVGRVVMTVALLLIGVALWLSKKIMDIEV